MGGNEMMYEFDGEMGDDGIMYDYDDVRTGEQIGDRNVGCNQWCWVRWNRFRWMTYCCG
ncbi:hypothetical protein DPMN_084805 [Dreissena polymorpha]|uniref:Uncharacterized protein n=1 Tax=Dreissena polymorpha TaxID=45954 RepID=A0A9D3YF76_DREPO|nr:hypothetical protein DPMN_084805 [Dreissena polymorpha]